MIDVFISYASEDRAAIAQPLAEELRRRRWSIWFDQFELSLGDNLAQKIDKGLAESRFGLVILSPSFFAKDWPKRELDGLTAREMGARNQKVILPVWHEVDQAYVATYSPPLAGKMAVRTTDGITAIADQVEYVLRSTSAIARKPAPEAAAKTTGRVRRLGLRGALTLEPDVHVDARGFLLETYRASDWALHGVTDEFVQDNHSRSSRGVLRGMHFTVGPGQAKLVRCARGAIVDVIVDLRRNSETYRQWRALELSDDNATQLYVPIGFGHGFCVLSNVADVLYSVSNYYDEGLERGFRWNDPDVAIAWPQGVDFHLSERDATAPMFRDIEHELNFPVSPAT